MPTRDHPAWLADVTAEDLTLVGIDPPEAAQSASAALTAWAQAYDVDLGRVHDCLTFLQSGPVLLLSPSPLAVMVYSPRRGTFRASFDLDFPHELADASLARAGAWLTVLSSEVGELPCDVGHWLSATVGASGLTGANVALLSWVQQYASTLRDQEPKPVCSIPLSDYDLQVSRAVWRCAAYATR